MPGRTGEVAEQLGADTIAYESFNVLVWVLRAKPDCQYAVEAMARSRKAHPEFSERDHPDFDHWHGEAGFIDPKEGFNFDEIIAQPPESYLNALLGAKEASSRVDRWSYLSNLKLLFPRDRNWAKGFIEATVRNGTTDFGIWQSIFSSWSETLKSHDDWNWMLGLIESLPQLPHVYGHAIYLLEMHLWRDELAATPEMAARGFAISMIAWRVCKDANEKLDGTHQDWLTSAINHPGGWIGQSWVHHSSYLKRRKEGIPPELRTVIIEALQGTDVVSVYARIAITPFVAYFYIWDNALAKDHFLPLYDWKRDRIVAQQTWSVVLNYEKGRNLEWEKILLPHYKALVEAGDYSQFDSHSLRALGWHLANLAVRAYENPLAEGFFREFLPLLPESSRAAMANVMGKYLKGLEPAAREKIWKAWLKEYLENRVVGIPIALNREEANEVAEWCLDFGDLFPELVGLVLKMPVDDLWAHKISETLLASPLLDKFPDAACEYVLLLLRAEKYPMMDEELKKLHERFKTLLPGSPKVRQLEEEMYKRGFKS